MKHWFSGNLYPLSIQIPTKRSGPRVQVSFTDEQHEMLVNLAKQKGFSKSAIIVLALEEYLKSQKQN